MKTRSAPWDYNKAVIIKAQIVKLCDECGGYVYWKNGYYCSSCPNTTFVKVYENEIQDFRRDLAEAKEAKELLEAEQEVNRIYKKFELTDELVDAFMKVIERPEYDPFYLDETPEPTNEELWHIENEPPTSDEQADAAFGQADLDGSDDRPSTQWREHGLY